MKQAKIINCGGENGRSMQRFAHEYYQCGFQFEMIFQDKKETMESSEDGHHEKGILRP